MPRLPLLLFGLSVLMLIFLARCLFKLETQPLFECSNEPINRLQINSIFAPIQNNDENSLITKDDLSLKELQAEVCKVEIIL